MLGLKYMGVEKFYSLDTSGNPNSRQDRENPDRDDPSNILIEASPVLLEQQNFFDQAPFADAIQSTIIAFGVEEESLRRALAIVTKTKPWQHLRKLTPVQLADWSKNKGKYDKSIGNVFKDQIGSKVDMATLRKAIPSMIGKLVEYPYWMEYVGQQLSYDFHRNDGSYNPRTKTDYLPIPSYAHFASEMQQIDTTLFKRGIEEVFAQEPIEEIVRATGKGSGRRNYLLRKASIT